MRRMNFLAARSLSNDPILIKAHSSRTRHTQKSLRSARRFARGDTGTLRFSSFIAVTSCGFSEAPLRRRMKLVVGAEARGSNLLRSNADGKGRISIFPQGCEFS